MCFTTHFRAFFFKGFFHFSLDLTAPNSFQSLARVDCTSRHGIHDPNKLFGNIIAKQPAVTSHAPTIYRSAENYGIIVDKKFRGNGIATTLITETRIILDQIGARILIIDGVAGVEKKWSESWQFYQSLNPHRLLSYKGKILLNSQQLEYEVSTLCLPTKETFRRPYVFK